MAPLLDCYFVNPDGQKPACWASGSLAEKNLSRGGWFFACAPSWGDSIRPGKKLTLAPVERFRRSLGEATMKQLLLHVITLALLLLAGGSQTAWAQPGNQRPRATTTNVLPYEVRIELFRPKDEDLAVFALKLEQPFLAEEFEQSNLLRLRSLDDSSFLIYPRETRFQQKHAEFYGRLRGSGQAKVRLSYEIVSEEADGSRKVDVRHTDLEISIPPEPTGTKRLYEQWANNQNNYFAELLRYYPGNSFLEYVLLQSKQRYGVPPPRLSRPAATSRQIEASLYDAFTGGLAIQETLQRRVLESGPSVGDRTVHISQLSPPELVGQDYKTLLQEKAKKGIAPRVHPISRLVPADHYLFHANTVPTTQELLSLAQQWGGSLLQLMSVTSQDHHLQQKYQRQLCVRLEDLAQLFNAGAATEVAFSGSDFNWGEGTDLTLLMTMRNPEVVRRALDEWVTVAGKRYPGLQQRQFNYRGHTVYASFTRDRMISAFRVEHDSFVALSTSHRAIRKIIDTITGKLESLHDQADYQYMTTVMPPQEDPQSAYLYASDAFIRRLVGPVYKIAEKRRRQSLNNLVMLNHASLFYRLDHGSGPDSLEDLVSGRFVDRRKILCPSGGSYSLDTKHDTATSSLYNRVKYLTPIIELVDDELLMVSQAERQQYDSYKQRYEAFWQGILDPIAIRLTVGPTVRVETCVLPTAGRSYYRQLRQWVDDSPAKLSSQSVARSAVLSVQAVPGRQQVGQILRSLPGVNDALDADPTLTDLSWLGDTVGLHICDADSVLEVDPTKMRALSSPFPVDMNQQLLGAAALAATNRPTYVTLSVEDSQKATRLLERLSSQLFLKGQPFFGLQTEFDAYRLPDYRDHQVQVLTYRLYAAKVRLYVSVVGQQLVAATQLDTLQEVIDAAGRPKPAAADNGVRLAHGSIRLNLRAIRKSRDDFQMYWSERARKASHRNILPIYTLIKLYDVPLHQVNELADRKYGVTYFCPDGEYKYDPVRDEVFSTVYGNRRNARQETSLNPDSSFARLLDSLEEIVVSARFQDQALLTSVEITRAGKN